MGLTSQHRRQLLCEARRWLGTSYDDRGADPAWSDPSAVPDTFDCSTYVCRVAIDALGYPPTLLRPDAAWLIDNLVEVAAPELGDVVGYERAEISNDPRIGYDRTWHIMLYAGNGMVIGACDANRAVVIQPIDYQPIQGRRQRRLDANRAVPFRQLAVRSN
jgi:cell wall-associated NlpC family hydrolase